MLDNMHKQPIINLTSTCDKGCFVMNDFNFNEVPVSFVDQL